MRIRHALVVTTIAAIGLVGCSSPSKVDIKGPPPTVDTGNIIGPEVLAVPPEHAGPLDHFGEGTHEVLTDIEPGVYKTTGPRGGGFPFCFWYRLSGTGGTLREIIASGESEGPVILTVYPSDKAVRTEYCAPWQRSGDAP